MLCSTRKSSECGGQNATCWGVNDHGQADASANTTFKSIAAGDAFSCGLGRTDASPAGANPTWGRPTPPRTHQATAQIIAGSIYAAQENGARGKRIPR